jgi:hypothetical protein
MTELKKSGWAPGPAQAILPGRAKTSSSRPNSEHFLVFIRVQQATARRGRHCQTGYAAAASGLGSHCRLVQRRILRTRTPGQPEANLKLTVTVTVAVPLASPSRRRLILSRACPIQVSRLETGPSHRDRHVSAAEPTRAVTTILVPCDSLLVPWVGAGHGCPQLVPAR